MRNIPFHQGYDAGDAYSEKLDRAILDGMDDQSIQAMSVVLQSESLFQSQLFSSRIDRRKSQWNEAE